MQNIVETLSKRKSTELTSSDMHYTGNSYIQFSRFWPMFYVLFNANSVKTFRIKLQVCYCWEFNVQLTYFICVFLGNHWDSHKKISPVCSVYEKKSNHKWYIANLCIYVLFTDNDLFAIRKFSYIPFIYYIYNCTVLLLLFCNPQHSVL